jgi:hypothetical protein
MERSRRRPLEELQNKQDELRTKRTKRLANNAVIDGAVKELLSMRASNGGFQKYGDVKILVEKYKRIGCYYVTRNVLLHRLKSCKTIPPSIEVKPCLNIISRKAILR